MAPPPSLPELMDDLIGEIFLRVCPDDPALLLRGSLVCKRWRHLLTSPAFVRRYRAFHEKPPLLGFLRNRNKESTSCFVPTTSFRPRDPERRNCRVLDCRHGRALLYVNSSKDYLVWDPRTGEERRIRNVDIRQHKFSAAVMCAADASCGHQDCHGGPFRIILVSTDDEGPVMYACVYSSESGEWSAPTTLQFYYYLHVMPPVLAGGGMYFMCEYGHVILRYDLHSEGTLSSFEAPEHDILHEFEDTALIPAGDCGLKYAALATYSLHLWSMEMMGADGFAGWTPLRVFELGALLPAPVRRNSISLIGTGPGPEQFDIIFVGTDVGVFAIGLKPRWIKKVYEDPRPDYYVMFPYWGFLTPDHVSEDCQRQGRPSDLE